MVLVQSAPQPQARQGLVSRIHPNPARILGIAGAIALNAALLTALTIPMRSGELPLPEVTERIPIQWILPEKKKEEKPVVVPITKPKPETPKPVAQPRVAPPVEDPPVVVDQAGPLDLPVVPPTPGPTVASNEVADPGPLPGVRLEYASASPPSYPRRALADRIEGQVLLQVLVDVDGKPLEVTIHRSSGNRELDRTAQQHVLRRWSFRPAMKDGRAVQAIGLVPIDFKLQ